MSKDVHVLLSLGNMSYLVCIVLYSDSLLCKCQKTSLTPDH